MGRDGNIRGVGGVRLAPDLVSPHLRLEGGFDLRCCPRELYPTFASGRGAHAKALLLQPSPCLLQIIGGGTEPVAKFFRSEPAMEIWRSFGLLTVEECMQLLLLFSSRTQHQDHPIHGCGAVHWSGIVRRVC